MKHFQALVDLAQAVCEVEFRRLADNEDFRRAIKFVEQGAARIEVRIGYTPGPSVTCALISEQDGETVGTLFSTEARLATIN